MKRTYLPRHIAIQILCRYYSPAESNHILDHAMTNGTALTAPRECPSLFIDTRRDEFCIMENDSGIVYTR